MAPSEDESRFDRLGRSESPQFGALIASAGSKQGTVSIQLAGEVYAWLADGPALRRLGTTGENWGHVPALSEGSRGRTLIDRLHRPAGSGGARRPELLRVAA